MKSRLGLWSKAKGSGILRWSLLLLLLLLVLLFLFAAATTTLQAPSPWSRSPSAPLQVPFKFPSSARRSPFKLPSPWSTHEAPLNVRIEPRRMSRSNRNVWSGERKMDLLPGLGHNRRKSNLTWCRWHGSSWGCYPLLFSQSGCSFCFVRKWCYWRFTVIIDNGSHASSHCSMVDAAFVFGSLAGLPYFPMNFILILADLGFSIIIGIIFGFTDNFVHFIW